MLIPTDLLKAAAMFAAKKDARFYLESVFIEWHDESAKIVATDGHRMFVASFAIESSGDAPRFSCIIPADTVKRALTGYKHETIEFCPPQAETAVIGGVVFEPIRAEYPDWRRVVPANASGEAGQFNAAYVGELGKAARVLLNRPKATAESLIHIHHNGVHGALVTFGARADCLVVLMPRIHNEMDASEALNIAESLKA